MSLLKTALLTALWIVVLCPLSQGETGNQVIKTYLIALQQMSRNCTMSYTATCSYPDNTKLTVAGRLVLSNGSYYDSSNARFVLMNKSWLVAADHQTKMLNVIYLPDWKKRMGKEFDLDITGYLLTNAEVEDFSAFKLNPVGKDSFTVSVRYNLEDGQVLDLHLCYAKGATIPSRYEGTLVYPLTAGDDGPGDARAGATKVAFAYRDISPSVDQGLFDDSRLIKVAGGKAQMKRYNDYKIHKRAS